MTDPTQQPHNAPDWQLGLYYVALLCGDSRFSRIKSGLSPELSALFESWSTADVLDAWSRLDARDTKLRGAEAKNFTPYLRRGAVVSPAFRELLARAMTPQS